MEGNVRFPAAGILAQLSLAPGKRFDAVRSRDDLERLHKLGIFEMIQLESRESGEGAIDLVFRVRERPVVSSFVIAGVNEAMERLILEQLRSERLEIRPGSPYREDQARAAAEAVRRLLMARKHPIAEVDTDSRRNGNLVQVTFEIKPGPRLEIGSVRFEGSQSVPMRELMSRMGNSRPASLFDLWSAGGRYLPEELESSRENLRRLYGARGFAAAAVGKAEVIVRAFPSQGRVTPHWGSTAPLKLDVRIPIVEGPSFVITSATTEGNAKSASSEVDRLIENLRIPRRYDSELLEKTRQDILTILGHHGYAHARVEVVRRFGANTAKADVIFSIEAGEPMLVGRIDFAGNSRVPDIFLRRQLRIGEGDVYDSSKLDRSIERLNRSGLIERLHRDDVDLQMDEEQNSIHVVFRVKEKDRRGIYMTGGTGGISGGYLGIIATVFNLLGLGEKLSFELDGGAALSNEMLNLIVDHFLGSPYSLAFSAANRLTGLNASNIIPGPQQIVGVFRRRSNLARVQGAYHISSKAGVGLGVQAERTSILEASTPEKASTGWSTSRRLTLQPSFALDTTNGGVQPVRGSQLVLTRSWSGPLSTAGFDTKLDSIRLRTCRPDPWTGGRNQFAFQLSGSLARPLAGQGLPVERRLFPADETVRGFAHGAIVPWSYDPAAPDSSLQPAGADTVLGFSGEYRVPMRGPISSAAFLDLGWTSLGSRSLAGPDSSRIIAAETNRLFRASVGGEMRILIPGVRQPARLIFAWNPLRLDSGFKDLLSFRRLMDPRGSVRFALGSIF
jgi:outer membrane protein insertion porin family